MLEFVFRCLLKLQNVASLAPPTFDKIYTTWLIVCLIATSAVLHTDCHVTLQTISQDTPSKPKCSLLGSFKSTSWFWSSCNTSLQLMLIILSSIRPKYGCRTEASIGQPIQNRNNRYSIERYLLSICTRSHQLRHLVFLTGIGTKCINTFVWKWYGSYFFLMTHQICKIRFLLTKTETGWWITYHSNHTKRLQTKPHKESHSTE